MALQGTLDTFALPDVLRLLAATHKTGRLRITGSRGTGSIWVEAGQVAALEATHAPHATEPVDSLFELLRFTDGAFTFDAEARHDQPGQGTDVEILISGAELLLEEWKQIEVVVPSLDAWVALQKSLPGPEVTIDQAAWTTLVAVGGGATVRRVADELCLGEMAVSRAVKDLVDLGVLSVELTAPAGAVSVSAALTPERPAAAPAVEGLSPLTFEPDAAEPAPRGPRAASRRSRAAAEEAVEPTEPALFVPLDLPGHTSSSYDEPEPELTDDVDDLAAAFPGLANRSAAPAPEPVDAADDEGEALDDADEELDDEDIARQLATLSPRAATAVRAAAEAGTAEERDAALDEVDADGEPLNRGLLLKFLSSVKT